MKNLLHNIQILMMLALMVVGIQSCSDDLQETGDVEVSFTATLPTDTRTRSFGKAEQVNTLVVGIFKKGVSDEHTNSGGSWSYYETDRKFFPISGTSIDVSLSLAQNQTYSFVFWAYDSSQNIYDIDDLTAGQDEHSAKSDNILRGRSIGCILCDRKRYYRNGKQQLPH